MLMLLLLILTADDQANIPKVERPDVVTLSPALKKAVDEVQKQCPTCATIDLSGGKQAWLTPKDQMHNMSQIDPPDGCTLTQWTLQASRDLKTSLEKALTAAEMQDFHAKEPANCDRKAFGYYLEVAKQLLPKQK
jgi:hypothetical protein